MDWERTRPRVLFPEPPPEKAARNKVFLAPICLCVAIFLADQAIEPLTH